MKKVIHHFVKYTLLTGTIIFTIASCLNDNLVDLQKKNTTATDSTSTPPPATGSTGTVSFSNDIKPIIAKYQCSGCHGSYYGSYNGIRSLAKNGTLYNTMSGAPGYRRMPPGQRVSTAELALIATWIKEGTLNN